MDLAPNRNTPVPDLNVLHADRPHHNQALGLRTREDAR
jgi:hypothetical protein